MAHPPGDQRLSTSPVAGVGSPALRQDQRQVSPIQAGAVDAAHVKDGIHGDLRVGTGGSGRVGRIG